MTRIPPSRAVLGSLVGLSVVAALLGSGPATAAEEAELPPQEPGVTLRTYDMARPIDQLCTLRAGQTPNVDKLTSLIDYDSPADFGLADRFISHALANLNIATAGSYDFRLISDDGSRLVIDGEEVIDHDGLHGETPKDGSVTLSEGYHDLRVEHFEDGGGEVLRLQWRPPGAADFSLVPTEVLSTEAGVVRVTAPGTKYCEGQSDSAGDGMQLDSVHPAYDLTDLRPEGFEPMVAALDWAADGRLAVVTSGSVSPSGWVEDPEPGEIFLLSNPRTATGPEDVTVEKVATDLFNPMGVAVIDESIFVSERDQLTELTDPDGDGFYDQHRKVAEWPFGENFHEFAFGLLHDEESFYVNLSVAINFGGATTDPQPARNRGTTLKIDRNTGEVTYLAGGLRTPNGMMRGPDGDLFVMDNQGAWLPSSKLVHVKPGRFFNHYTNPSGPFDDKPVTGPALWVPQGEIGNSPSSPMMLEKGAYAGQMIFGDVTYGGLQRGFLEKVEGEYQGAVFRYSAGLEAGVNRTLLGPDGSIYVGGIGEAGNWSEPGKLRYGLQRMSPADGKAFDMHQMRATQNGFEIRYTQALSQETVDKIATDPNAAFRMTHWRYAPRPTYGGPKVDERPLFVSGAEVSADRTKVTLTVDGLEEGRVVHLRSPRPFTGVGGEELWNTEAWYTLNEIPGYVSPADRNYLEAEQATLRGSANVAVEHNGYSGSGFVDGFGNVGASVTFDAQVARAGTYPVRLRYANGPDPAPGTKRVSVHLNGTEVEPWALESTGDWQTWGTATRSMRLKAGVNRITVSYEQGDEGNVNLDALKIGGGEDICTPQRPAPGYKSLFDGTLSSLASWRMAGPGSFGRQDDCSLRTTNGLGLLWYAEQEFSEYSLKLDWKLVRDDNGGVFIGFPNPGNDPWVAVNQGYEVQIDASDAPDRTTGAIYTFQGADPEAVAAALKPVGSWNSYDIRVEGSTVKIFLNGKLVNDFTSTDPARDLAGFIGMQNHGGGETVYYRNVQMKELTD
ncbi:family 16 glycoside hydrolase [Nocardioides sp. NPDC023903]|uniref:family 16 glycoside hydrolase n=1 Tax=Nocardioides sp. NPDC023903 TaxID=3157195 RepID=UPI0033C46D61